MGIELLVKILLTFLDFADSLSGPAPSHIVCPTVCCSSLLWNGPLIDVLDCLLLGSLKPLRLYNLSRSAFGRVHSDLVLLLRPLLAKVTS